jgi:hypothetical protein
MSENIKYTCSNCGKDHEEWPALAYDSPTSYNVLSEEMRQEIGELTSDFCIVRHPEQADRFIRCTLTLKVNDQCEVLEYGLWVSLSEKSYQDYSENYGNPEHQATYFGWLSNDLPDYEISESIPTTVYTRSNGLRPEIVPHDDCDHQLIHDYYHGISKIEAERRIQNMLKIVDERVNDVPASKPWWKMW